MNYVATFKEDTGIGEMKEEIVKAIKTAVFKIVGIYGNHKHPGVVFVNVRY